MIIDVTGVELIPGDRGKNCPGNGLHFDQNGASIECCCDECDYMMCCLPTHSMETCVSCTDAKCPHAGKAGQ